MIQLEGIVKRYAMGDGLVAALDGVDLSIELAAFDCKVHAIQGRDQPVAHRVAFDDSLELNHWS